MSAYKALGVLVFIYTAYSAYIGEVYAKDKASVRTVHTYEESRYSGVVIACLFAFSRTNFFIF